jgi:hypothetical protein
MASQRRSLDRLAAGRTWHRGGVNQAQLIPPARRAGGQVAQGQGDQRRGPAQPPVVGRGGRQIREQMAQPAAGEPQPAPLAVEAEQHLGDGQTDQLGVTQLGLAARAVSGPEQVVDGDLQCRDEGVEVGVHEASQEVDVASATPTLGASLHLSPLRSLNPIRKQSSSGRREFQARSAAACSLPVARIRRVTGVEP